MAYAWMIHKDHTAEPGTEYPTWRNAKGTWGPRGASEDDEKALKKKEGTKFRMYDDDGILYYTGTIVGKFRGLEPLHDFGAPNAGAVRIELYKDGKWEAV